jgi:nicotinamidase-related amidase
MKAALLIIDMQTVFIRGRIEEKTVAHACEYINYAADALRKNGHLVVHVQDVEGMDRRRPRSAALRRLHLQRGS